MLSEGERDGHHHRARGLHRLSALPPARRRGKLVCIDETGTNAKMVRTRGRCPPEPAAHRQGPVGPLDYGFDLIELDGEDLRDRRFLECKGALARLLSTLRRESCSTTRHRGWPYRLCERSLAWRRGHRLKEGRWSVSIGAVPGLDQGAQSASVAV